MGNPFDAWLVEVAGDSLLVDEAEGGLEREARGNLWSFSISLDQATALTQADVTAFIDAVVEARRRQIMRIPGSQSMTFYCWHDERASQLRFSLVSASHGGLPFGTRAQERKDVGDIVKLFLSSPYHDGLPMGEFELPPKPTDQDAPAAVLDPLLVWVKRLPQSGTLT